MAFLVVSEHWQHGRYRGRDKHNGRCSGKGCNENEFSYGVRTVGGASGEVLRRIMCILHAAAHQEKFCGDIVVELEKLLEVEVHLYCSSKWKWVRATRVSPRDVRSGYEDESGDAWWRCGQRGRKTNST